MTPPCARIVVFVIVIHLLITVNGFSTKDFLDIFENPVSNFINAVSPKKIAKNIESSSEDKTEGSMIDVPINTDRCKDGKVKDVNGVCREPW